MTQTIELICVNCKHFDRVDGGCKAFPDGIPQIILVSNNHSEPLEEQDNDIVFEPIDEE